MRISHTVEIHKSIIPPRCRKPRYVPTKVEVSYDIPEVGLDLAPVAIIQRGSTKYGGVDRIGFNGKTVYHVYQGKLYTRVRYSHFVCLNSKKDRQATIKDIYVDSRWGSTHSEQEAQDRYAQCMSEYLIIEGKLCIEIGEPRYVVSTFGLGCNHGGTSLMVDNSYNSNISKDRYFRCDDFASAKAFHKKLALLRGDTKSLPVYGAERFEVLLPEVLRIDPQTQHGDGDPFLNKLESFVEGFKDPTMAGLAGLMLVGRELSDG